jgi:hypothetical protein
MRKKTIARSAVRSDLATSEDACERGPDVRSAAGFARDDAAAGSGEDLSRSVPATVAEWLAQGWLTRRFPAGASEEVYALSAEAADAVRFIDGLVRPRLAATKSRLATVMEQLTRLAEETNPNPEKRIEALLIERARIDREIESVKGRHREGAGGRSSPGTGARPVPRPGDRSRPARCVHPAGRRR